MLFDKSSIPFLHLALIGFLPSPLKKFVYRLLGYKIGSHVSIGIGAVIAGKKVEIGDYTQIGFLTVIKGREITIGKHVIVGSTSIVNTHFIEIDDGAMITEQVFVGGQDSPDSVFKMGKNSILMYQSYVNTARRVEIGDDSGVGGHCLIFSHGAWLSEFEGYPISRQPVTIGKGVWLPWRVFVMPGVSIGDGSVIGADSYVNKSVPANSLAAGSPIKILKENYPAPISDEKKREVFEGMKRTILEYFRFHHASVEGAGQVYDLLVPVRRLFSKGLSRYKVVFIDDEKFSELESSLGHDKLDLCISLKKIPDPLKVLLKSNKVHWLEVETKIRSRQSKTPLVDEMASFIGRYGVRFLYE